LGLSVRDVALYSGYNGEMSAFKLFIIKALMAYNKKYADWKRKIWFTIKAPAIFNEVELGETPAYKPEQVIGRRVELNMALVTNNYQLQNYKGIFKITKVEGTTAKTELEGIKMYESIIQKWVEPGRDKITDSFVIKDKDNRLVRVKPVLITNRRLHRKQGTAIRNIWRNYFVELGKKLSFEDMVMKILNKEIPEQLKIQIKKIYPPLFFAIRQFYLEPREKHILLIE